MKKLITFLILLMVLPVFAEHASANYDTKAVLATVHRPYDVILNEIQGTAAGDSNDTALTATTSYWDAIQPGVGNFKRIDATYSYLEIAFIVDGSTDPNFIYNPNNSCTFAFKVWAARWYSSAVLVYQGTATTGNLSLSRDPGNSTDTVQTLSDPNMIKWVDTISPATLGDAWYPAFCDVTSNTSTADGIARLTFDLIGHGCVWVEITTIVGDPYRIRAVASGLGQ